MSLPHLAGPFLMVLSIACTEPSFQRLLVLTVGRLPCLRLTSCDILPLRNLDPCGWQQSALLKRLVWLPGQSTVEESDNERAWRLPVPRLLWGRIQFSGFFDTR